MKTITFFSEKGGVGKSSFSIMYASWLQKNGISVALADFNNRISRYRDSEIRARNKFIENNPEAGVAPFDESKAWPIVNAWSKDVEPYKNDSNKPYAAWFRDKITRGELMDFDVVLCDFPGSMADGSFTDLLQLKLLNLIVIPTERDEMTLTSTLRLHQGLKGNNRKYCCFINKAQINLKNFRGSYLALGRRLASSGLPMLPDMISYSERMTAIDKVDIIRSTFGFPDFEKPEFNGLSDLGITNLFIDVTKELAKTDDLPGTGACDLSFINEMTKKDDGRWFRGSAFPEYEF